MSNPTIEPDHLFVDLHFNGKTYDLNIRYYDDNEQWGYWECNTLEEAITRITEHYKKEGG